MIRGWQESDGKMTQGRRDNEGRVTGQQQGSSVAVTGQWPSGEALVTSAIWSLTAGGIRCMFDHQSSLFHIMHFNFTFVLISSPSSSPFVSTIFNHSDMQYHCAKSRNSALLSQHWRVRMHDVTLQKSSTNFLTNCWAIMHHRVDRDLFYRHVR
jgi:hypothetical protein